MLPSCARIRLYSHRACCILIVSDGFPTRARGYIRSCVSPQVAHVGYMGNTCCYDVSYRSGRDTCGIQSGYVLDTEKHVYLGREYQTHAGYMRDTCRIHLGCLAAACDADVAKTVAPSRAVPCSARLARSRRCDVHMSVRRCRNAHVSSMCSAVELCFGVCIAARGRVRACARARVVVCCAGAAGWARCHRTRLTLRRPLGRRSSARAHRPTRHRTAVHGSFLTSRPLIKG